MHAKRAYIKSSIKQVWKVIIRLDTSEEFNLQSTAECGQLNLAHAARNKKNIEKKLKQTKASAHLVWYRLRSVKAVQKE